MAIHLTNADNTETYTPYAIYAGVQYLQEYYHQKYILFSNLAKEAYVPITKNFTLE